MTGTPPTPAQREEHLNQVLLEYLEACQAGFPPDRAEILTRHPELRSDLEEFFAGHDAVHRVSAPLREAAQAPETTPVEAFAADPDIGLLGDFRLLREIWRGGMGVVYEAEQISLRRRVALKVLPFVSALDNRQLQRFKTEAMAAAQLHHTNIVPVYAVGSERGVHFDAMQLIEGRSLAAVIRELRGDAPEESSHPSQETTAAHHSGVTQRDFRLNPSTAHTARSRDSFRTVVQDTKDTAFVIFAVSVGMAIGAGQPAVALGGTIAVGFAAWLLRDPPAAATDRPHIPMNSTSAWAGPPRPRRASGKHSPAMPATSRPSAPEPPGRGPHSI